MTAARTKLQELVDALPDDAVPAAVGALERLRNHGELDPLLQALLSAPDDDEPTTAEDLQAVEEAERDLRAGRVVSADEARQQILGP